MGELRVAVEIQSPNHSNTYILHKKSSKKKRNMYKMHLVIFLKKTKRQGFMLWIPMAFMMAVTFTAIRIVNEHSSSDTVPGSYAHFL